LKLLVLPIYFGLAIVVPEERLARAPQLRSAVGRLESAEGQQELLRLAERLRLEAVTSQHNFFYGTMAKIDRGAERYLDLLKGALLNQHYLENEVRIWYLLHCHERGRTPDLTRLRDPARQLRSETRRLEQSRQAGEYRPEDGEAVCFPYAAMGRTRLDRLERCLETVRVESVPGDLMECGTWRGGGAIFMRGFLDAYEMRRRQVWVADGFRGIADGDTGQHPAPNVANMSESASSEDWPLGAHGDLNVVRDGFARFDLLDDRVRFLQGEYRETLPGAPLETLALLRVDASSYESTLEVLSLLYDKVADGGFVIIEGYSNESCRRAVDEFRALSRINSPLERTDWTSACWRKEQLAGSAELPELEGGGGSAPLAPPLPAESCDLSIIVCVYNMRREAERTLYSLSRAYQRGIEGLAYEVIVVENGSEPGQKLDEQLVASLGPEFTYLDLDNQAAPSPVNALNRGVAAARGEHIALMIDGAHMLTPGVLRFGMLGLQSYAPAVVVTQQWYVGPGQQNDAVRHGYDQEYEDRLFEEIGWPGDGYRLFDVGHFVGDRDWFDGLWESNCIFVPRKVLEQVGSFDESFSMPGGGYANLDLYERVAADPDTTLVSILGEGSFHQVHGGTTTNEGENDARLDRLEAYKRHYAQLRGRFLRGPGKPVHYVGSVMDATRRTRARRLSAPAYFRTAQAHAADQRPGKPVPIPDELKVEFIDAFWRSESRRGVNWLGWQAAKCPTDLLAYQELIVRVRPDWVIETGTGAGGRALFLATVCELLGTGQVLSVDDGTGAPADKLPKHPRLVHVDGDATAIETISRVRELVGEPPSALLVFGLAGRDRLERMWDAYSGLVPIGSYVVFEETVTNGNPVWPGMGPGPREAVKEILQRSPGFASDPTMEKLGLTFNPGGYLKRRT
jgi:cephalosporin hydroxylase